MILKRSILYIAAFIGLLSLIFSCKPSTVPNCRAGVPTPIFSDSIKGVRKHNFIRKGQSGIEIVILGDNSMIEIVQSGCDEILQQYTHTRKVNMMNAPDSFFVNAAILEFSGYAQLDPKLAPFGEFANAIQNIKPSIKLAEPANLGEGYMVTIDRILSPNSTSLLISISKKISAESKSNKDVKW
jgi:hypothetical protein